MFSLYIYKYLTFRKMRLWKLCEAKPEELYLCFQINANCCFVDACFLFWRSLSFLHCSV